MISEAIKAEDSYQDRLSRVAVEWIRIATKHHGSSDCARVRWTDFEELGFPAVEDEEWKYTNVAPIARMGFSPVAARDDSALAISESQLAEFSYPEARATQLVFVNGLLNAKLSSLSDLPAGVVAIDFEEALASEPFQRGHAREYLGRIVDYGENGFTALNTAFIANGALVVIPKGVSMASPLHLLFLTNPVQPSPGSVSACAGGRGRKQQRDNY